jgi:hypothetical protein
MEMLQLHAYRLDDISSRHQLLQEVVNRPLAKSGFATASPMTETKARVVNFMINDVDVVN